MPIHRTIKNVVKNYTHAEVKVREATSNDPWGPPSMVMAEIAQMSHDLLAFSEIMPMIWKRLNDHGKNWRHVYKSLILLDYLVKAGSERVVQYCMENIISIQTLKDFQHFEDGVDHGQNIREKAKQLVALLKDTDKLRNERSRATNVKNRFGISTGYALTDSELRSSSPPAVSSFSSSTERRSTPSYASESPARPVHVSASFRPAAADSEMESVRPSTTNEEELQLQLALAMSKEEHDEEIKKRKGDEIKLQMAIEESRKTAQHELTQRRHMPSTVAAAPPLPRQQFAQSQPWDWEAGNAVADSWSAPLEPKKDPWSSGVGPRTRDPRDGDRRSSPVYAEIQKNLKPEPAPWEEVAAKYSSVETNFANPPIPPHDDFVQLRAQPVGAEKKQNIEKWLDSNLTAEDSDDDLWDINEVDGAASADGKKAKTAKKVTPEEFLGPNAKLVDFDDLVSKPVTTSAVNPFAMTINKSTTVNPFVAKAQEEEKSRKVPLNQLQLSASSSSFTQTSSSLLPSSGLTVTGFPPPTLAVVYPTQPIMQHQGYNPFL